jgi:hypothetical protein
MAESVWHDAAWPCKECIDLTQQLASVTFEAVSIEKDLLAQKRVLFRAVK